MSTSLYRTVNVEIEDRERFHFDNFSPTVAYEKLLDSNLEEADAFVTFGTNEYNVSICTELSDSGDLAWKSLCLKHESFKRKHTVLIDHINQGSVKLTLALSRPIESMTCYNCIFDSPLFCLI